MVTNRGIAMFISSTRHMAHQHTRKQPPHLACGTSNTIQRKALLAAKAHAPVGRCLCSGGDSRCSKQRPPFHSIQPNQVHLLRRRRRHHLLRGGLRHDRPRGETWSNPLLQARWESPRERAASLLVCPSWCPSGVVFCPQVQPLTASLVNRTYLRHHKKQKRCDSIIIKYFCKTPQTRAKRRRIRRVGV
jgi:hypothetical protein